MDDENLIQQFLQDNLDQENKILLQKRLETDPDFAERLQIESVFYAQRNKDLKDKLRAVKNNEKVVPSLTIRWKRILSIAATVALLVSAIFFYQSTQVSSVYSNLIENYTSEKPDAPITTMGTGSANELWNQAIKAYQNNEYQNVIDALSNISEPTAEQEFYHGISLMRSAPPLSQKAFNVFNKIIERKDALFRDQAMWYGALCLLDIDQKEQATTMLQKIIATKSWRHEDAQKLLDSIQ